MVPLNETDRCIFFGADIKKLPIGVDVVLLMNMLSMEYTNYRVTNVV